MLESYRKYGPVYYTETLAMKPWSHWGRTPPREVFSTEQRFSTVAWNDVIIGPFFDRGLLLMDGGEHMFHRRIMRRKRRSPHPAVRHITHIDTVARHRGRRDWSVDDTQVPVPARDRELTLDISATVFMGHEPGSDHDLVTKIKAAYGRPRPGPAGRSSGPRAAVQMGGADCKPCKVLEDYFTERVAGGSAAPRAPTCSRCSPISPTRTETPSPTPTSSTT